MSRQAGPEEVAPGVTLLVAPNPGPMTLEGTNTWVVASEAGAWVIDPGPADPGHLDRVRAAAKPAGGIAGTLLTHSHLDHSQGVEALGAPLVHGEPGEDDEASAWLAVSLGAPVEPAGASPPAAAVPAGPFGAHPTPGHSADHVAFTLGRLCFCGDLILGRGSSIVPPRAAGGSLADYLQSLDRVEALGAELLLPGHGPVCTDPVAKIAEYRDHRLDRERRLLAALEAGKRSRAALLAEVWDDVPEALLPAAALAMRAHLEKLAADGVEVGGLEA